MTGVVNEQPDLLEGTFYTQDPYPTYAWLREHDPVHWHPETAPDPGFWAITKHEDVVAVSKNPQVFSSGEGLTMLEEVEPESLEKRRSLIDSDAPLHQHLRKPQHKIHNQLF